MSFEAPTVAEVRAALEAATTIERKTFDEETQSSVYTPIDLADALDLADASTSRFWVRVNRRVWYLRFESGGESYSLTSVHPPS